MQTQFVGDSLRDTYKLCEAFQLLPTATRQEGVAALTLTHVPICHQRESWEAGAASPACQHHTLLTAGAIFCKRQKKYVQHDHDHPPGHSFTHNDLNFSSLFCFSAESIPLLSSSLRLHVDPTFSRLHWSPLPAGRSLTWAITFNTTESILPI